jgi:hypothetical protein
MLQNKSELTNLIATLDYANMELAYYSSLALNDYTQRRVRVLLNRLADYYRFINGEWQVESSFRNYLLSEPNIECFKNVAMVNRLRGSVPQLYQRIPFMLETPTLYELENTSDAQNFLTSIIIGSGKPELSEEGSEILEKMIDGLIEVYPAKELLLRDRYQILNIFRSVIAYERNDYYGSAHVQQFMLITNTFVSANQIQKYDNK